MERFVQVAPSLFRGSAPTDKEVSMLKNVWGVNRIVSLDLDTGEKIANICEKENIEQILLPIESGPEMLSSLELLSKNILKLFDKNLKTFVHCYHGKDRTGLAVALYRIQAENWLPIEAYKEATSLGFCKGLSPKVTKLYNSYLFDKPKKEDSNELMPHVGLVETGYGGGAGFAESVSPIFNGYSDNLGIFRY